MTWTIQYLVFIAAVFVGQYYDNLSCRSRSDETELWEAMVFAQNV